MYTSLYVTGVYCLFHCPIPDAAPKAATVLVYNAIKGKAVPLQGWGGPEGSRKLRFEIS